MDGITLSYLRMARLLTFLFILACEVSWLWNICLLKWSAMFGFFGDRPESHWDIWTHCLVFSHLAQCCTCVRKPKIPMHARSYFSGQVPLWQFADVISLQGYFFMGKLCSFVCGVLGEHLGSGRKYTARTIAHLSVLWECPCSTRTLRRTQLPGHEDACEADLRVFKEASRTGVLTLVHLTLFICGAKVICSEHSLHWPTQ